MEDRIEVYLRARRLWSRVPHRSIPVLDAAAYLAGEPGAASRLASELQQAQQNIGFFFLNNHAVPERLIERSFAAVEEFFALPLEQKLALSARADFTGYIPVAGSQLRNSYVGSNREPDLTETMNYMRDVPEDSPQLLAGRRMMGPNKWPAAQPWLKPIIQAYMRESMRLAYRLLPLYALALGAAADYFDDKFDDPSVNCRSGHYPPVSPRDDQFGLGAHTDLGFLTLLPPSKVAGLQIQTLEGEWIDVPHLPGHLLVNGGDMLARFSNGQFLATPHRVLPNRGPAHRYSLPIFFQPNFSTLVAPMPSCVDAEHPALFEPVRFGEYREWYVAQVSDRYELADLASASQSSAPHANDPPQVS
ncbi:MAG TPA: 2-oxoglutarate and iron-dependent oxygenase domain-containing protein [Steroidobacteraceae bacterium]|jgi:isopenicillin N synthase-like dioxygenase